MKCPGCNEEATLTTPDYGFGYGTEYRCYNMRCPRANRYSEYTFVVKGEEAAAESDASRARSRANADEFKKENR